MIHLKVVFFLCDDMPEFLEIIKQHICSIIKRHSEIDFDILTFHDYDDLFFKTARKTLIHKIFILDIEMPTMNGFQCAKKLREYDEQSYILLITTYFQKYTVEALNGLIGQLVYIDKLQYQEKLSIAIDYILKRLNQKSSFHFMISNIHYRIDLNTLKYIHYEKIERKSIFYSTNIIASNFQLCEIYEQLDDRYQYSHRACIVNLEQIKSITKTEIIFYDGTTIDYLSRTYRKNLVQAFLKYKNTH